MVACLWGRVSSGVGPPVLGQSLNQIKVLGREGKGASPGRQGSGAMRVPKGKGGVGKRVVGREVHLQWGR